MLGRRFEVGERLFPEAFEVLPHFGEAIGVDAVQTPRPVLSFRHQTRLLQDPEMLRHRRPADRKPGRYLSDCPGAVAELFENRPPGRITERLQCLFVSHDLP